MSKIADSGMKGRNNNDYVLHCFIKRNKDSAVGRLEDAYFNYSWVLRNRGPFFKWVSTYFAPG